jgi:hypothetical protein
MDRPEGGKTLEHLHNVVSRHARRLMAKANVVGVGVGYKETGGRQTDTEAVVVLVSRKVHPSRLRRADLVPKSLSEAKTDVVEVGELRLLPALGPIEVPALDEPSRRVRRRPAEPGVSLGHYQITAGTFGALVYERDTRAPMILSNNHVLANLSDGRDGRAKPGDPVYQPGRYDGGGVNDTIAHLERYVPIVRATTEDTCPIARRAERVGNLLLCAAFPGREIRFLRKTGAENRVDAAVAALIRPEDAVPEILGIGPVGEVAEPRPGMKVVKSGRTTGVTRGEVQVIGATVRVGLGEVGVAVFTDQVVTTAMAQPGDSGSLVLTEEDHRPVGLLCAGSSMATVLNRISNVLELLRVTF